MPAAGIATLVGVFLTVVVLAVFLISVVVILKHVFGQLEIILEAVSDVSVKAAPAGAVIDAINSDLAAGHTALDAAVVRLKERTTAFDAQDSPTAAGSTDAPASGGWWQR